MLGERLTELNEYISFHTPGHSGGMIDFPPFNVPLTATDTTETPFTDDLKYPESIIAEAEEFVRKAYGAESAMFSTAGATALVQTAVYRNRKERFLVFEAAHSSVYNALRLSGAEAFQSVGIPPERAVAGCGATAVIITSPDYYGRIIDPETVKKLNSAVKVIVDASHGAHFAFSDKLPVSATEYADTVIHSLHKTMPVMTGGAVMHVRADEYEDHMSAFRLFHTTSPSYPVMASIEGAVRLFSERGKALYDKVYSDVADFKKAAEQYGYALFESDDFSRVTISVPGGGKALYGILTGSGIVPEFRSADTVTLIVTPYNSGKLGAVADVLAACPCPRSERAPHAEPPKGVFRLEFANESERVPLSDCIGRRAFGAIGEYPPGTPGIFPGQVIGAEEYRYLSRLLPGASFGLDKGCVDVIK